MSAPRTLQSRVLALTGAGVFIAAAALALLSRRALLDLQARVDVERQDAARVAAYVLARDLSADATVPTGSDALTRRLTDPAHAASVRDLLASGRGLHLAPWHEGQPPDAGVRIAGTSVSVVATAPSDVTDTLLAFRRRSLWLAPSVAALALTLAWGLALSVRRPLAELTASAERIAAGNLRDPVPGGGDEVGRLGTALENMRVRLQASRAAQLQRLLGKIISAQEDERRRVARELHDETSQVLTALGIALHPAGTMASEQLHDLQTLVDRMHDGLHRLIVNLRPPAIDDLGLGAAIGALANSQLRSGGLNVRCELGELQDRRVDPAIEIAVFRVVQEALLNVVRHSAASAVVIEGGLTGGRLWIDIEDDGCGFDPTAISPDDHSLRGIGLIGMRERVEMLGGRLEIDSAPGQGTRVRVDVRVIP
jgi:signal transduction histidine kinase